MSPTTEAWPLMVQPVAGAASIHEDDRTGRFGVMYFRALLAQAGVVHSEISGGEDHLAVDLTVTFDVGTITVQVKCGTRRRNNDGSITLPIEAKWKEKWSHAKTPVYLVYVRLEKKLPADWIEHGDLHTLSHATAQWIQVNGLSGASVRVPLANRLTVETLDGWADQFVQEWGKAAGI